MKIFGKKKTILLVKRDAHVFRGNTLGLPKICPEENIGAIDRQTLYTYLSAFHRYIRSRIIDLCTVAGPVPEEIYQTLLPIRRKETWVKYTPLTSVADPDPPVPHVLGLPDPDPLVRGVDSDPAPDPHIIKQK